MEFQIISNWIVLAKIVALSLRPKTHNWYEFKVYKKSIIQIFAWENVFKNGMTNPLIHSYVYIYSSSLVSFWPISPISFF